jgi:aminoglycoside phosphotransferase (APT) family kinase protein
MSGPDPDALGAVLSKAQGSPVTVSGLQRLTGGASQETWRFVADTAGEQRALILRRVPGGRAEDVGDVGGSVMGASVSLSTEAAVLAVAADNGVPVPQVVAVLTPSDGLGGGYVMSCVEGETLPRKLLRDEAFAQVRPQLPAQCGRALAAIHAVDAEGLRDRLAVLDAERTLSVQRSIYDTFGHRSPAFEAAFAWLADHLPEAHEPVLVHGDFRNGNLMIDPEGIQGVLDWELCHLGDPHEDLGWLCAPSWRFGNMDAPVGGFGQRQELFDAYSTAAGNPVDPERVRFWEVMAILKWGIITLSMFHAFASGLDRGVEKAAIGRRFSETEIDLVDALYGLEGATNGAGHPGEGGGDGGAGLLQRSPTAGELLEAVEGFLRNTAVPELDAASSYHARVAANAVAIVARELAEGQSEAALEWGRIGDLLGDDPKEGPESPGFDALNAARVRLCEAIRDGSITPESGALAAHLRANAVAAVGIDQPKYATYRNLPSN